MNTKFRELKEGFSENPSTRVLSEAAQKAWKRIPPLWPLSRFVAVNPFLGFSDLGFLSASSLLKKTLGTSLAMPLSFYASRYHSGLITKEDLKQAAVEMMGESISAGAKVDFLIACFSEADGHLENRPTTSESSKSFIIQEISKWCTAYFDQGQGAWSFPWKNQSLFIAWKQAALIDLNPRIAGVTGWKKYITDLPDDPCLAIEAAVLKLNVPEEEYVDLFYSLLMSINGWAGYLQFLAHEKKLKGEEGGALYDLLAIRVAYEAAFQLVLQKENSLQATLLKDEELTDSLLCQRAHEIARQRLLFKKIAQESSKKVAQQPASKDSFFQAVFCIDVRSEVYRRSLESTAPGAQTIGFAGFFGFPVAFIRAGEERALPQCPVLIAPTISVSEQCDGKQLEKLQLRKKIVTVWKSFKSSAVSSFVFVEVAGLGFFFSILKSLLNVPQKDASSLGCHELNLESISLQTQVNLAENALRHMGLAKAKLAPIILICGHGSKTENNPYASSLDCGACGGHSGEITARTAVAVLNNSHVRAELAKKDIIVPDETYFIAGLHNTTTDSVTLYHKERVPKSHLQEMAALEHHLAEATLLAQQERASLLGLDAKDSNLKNLFQKRSQDWSQVMPEWGLAGNYAFIGAPRARTRHMNLEGRVFLHDYTYRNDQDEATLSLLLSAPVVVASWINLQYYASTVDNKHFGSGDKTIHNVAGILGILEGNGGDIRTGLPFQSLHDGKKWRHEPLRLHVCIEAPKEAIDRALKKHPSVADLVVNKWIYLFSMSEDGTLFEKSNGRGEWTEESF